MWHHNRSVDCGRSLGAAIRGSMGGALGDLGVHVVTLFLAVLSLGATIGGSLGGALGDLGVHAVAFFVPLFVFSTTIGGSMGARGDLGVQKVAPCVAPLAETFNKCGMWHHNRSVDHRRSLGDTIGGSMKARSVIWASKKCPPCVVFFRVQNVEGVSFH